MRRAAAAGHWALGAAFLGALVLQGSGAVGARADELALRSNYAISKDPLTTEKALILDPDEANPHRQRWLLNRNVELVDLKPRELKPGGLYGVSAGGLDARTTAYFRGDGPWYHPLTDFPCDKTPASWFATAEGTRVAADAAAKHWDSLLEADRIQLSVALRRLTGSTPGAVLEKAHDLFALWLRKLDGQWRTRGRAEARDAEWRYYWKELAGSGQCAASKQKAGASYNDEYVPASKHGPVPWELMMEPPAVGPQGEAGMPIDANQLLARAPAKPWNGALSIRLNLTVAGHKLNGTFLVDTGSGTSVISPDFLAGQGILPVWIEVPGAPLRRIPWGGSGGEQGGLAPVVAVDSTEIGNTPVRLREFALFDSEFFAPPDYPGSCCDGVLGTDFLRHYVVELQPGPPAEVKLWPVDGFHAVAPGADGASSSPLPWIEAALSPDGASVSQCVARLSSIGGAAGEGTAGRAGAKPGPRLQGALWETAHPSALEVHVPWQKEARAYGLDAAWDILCGPGLSEPIARGVPAEFPRNDGTPLTGGVGAKVPAFSVGMGVLGRGRVYLDFPHGRIWFSDKLIDHPAHFDRSGLVLRYQFIPGKGDTRGLFVKAIASSSPASALRKRGLRPGMMITQIDKQDVGGLDSRQISSHLSGDFGKQVYVQWQSAQGLRLGVIDLSAPAKRGKR